MNIYQLRSQAGREEIDFAFIINSLKKISAPRDKITEFLRKKELIRVKKGLYVFGKEAAREPFHPEVLANLIYGPSAISLEYALAFYGLLPERVYTITSITNKRNKYFATPIGDFSYHYLHPKKYAVGITLVRLDECHSIFMATPEKALADMLLFSSQHTLKDEKELAHYLFDDLRLDEEIFYKLNTHLMAEIADVYQKDNISLLAEYLKNESSRIKDA